MNKCLTSGYAGVDCVLIKHVRADVGEFSAAKLTTDKCSTLFAYLTSPTHDAINISLTLKCERLSTAFKLSGKWVVAWNSPLCPSCHTVPAERSDFSSAEEWRDVMWFDYLNNSGLCHGPWVITLAGVGRKWPNWTPSGPSTLLVASAACFLFPASSSRWIIRCLFIVNERSVSVAWHSHTKRPENYLIYLSFCFLLFPLRHQKEHGGVGAHVKHSKLADARQDTFQTFFLPIKRFSPRILRQPSGTLNLETQWIKVDIGDCYKAERYWRQRWKIIFRLWQPRSSKNFEETIKYFWGQLTRLMFFSPLRQVSWIFKIFISPRRKETIKAAKFIAVPEDFMSH